MNQHSLWQTGKALLAWAVGGAAMTGLYPLLDLANLAMLLIFGLRTGRAVVARLDQHGDERGGSDGL